jgi:hypothetical protein
VKRLVFVFLFVASLAASAVFLIAAASATPSATPARTPPQAPTFTRTQPRNATPMLGSTSPIVFRGWVVSGPTKEEPIGGPCDWWWWVVQVEIDEVVKMEQEQGPCGMYDYVSGETIDVLYFANDAPEVAVDDYVEVSGEESMFSCICQGCCCDACGFIFSPLALACPSVGTRMVELPRREMCGLAMEMAEQSREDRRYA